MDLRPAQPSSTHGTCPVECPHSSLPTQEAPAPLTWPVLGLLALAGIPVLGQRAEHDGLAAVQAQLYAVAAVVLMDLQLAEAHGCPAELTHDGALRAFPGLRGGRQDGQVTRQEWLSPGGDMG